MSNSLRAVYAVLALASVALNLAGPRFGTGAVKALPLLLLGVVAARYTRPRFGMWIVVGALCGAAGDFSLAHAQRSWFLPGLAAFLAGHIAYCGAFARDLRGDARRLRVIVATLAGMTALAAAAVVRLANAGEAVLIGPVIVYVSVMGAMTVLAVLHRSVTWSIAVGAVVFVISDAHIALNHMLLAAPSLPVTLSGYATYYLAQYLIVSGAAAEAQAGSSIDTHPRPT